MLVTTHYMDEAEYCDRISIMVAGRIAAIGTPAELKQQFGADSIDELFVRLARPAAAPARAAADERAPGPAAKGGATTSCATGGRSPSSCCMPVVQVMLFGYAIRTDVNDVRLAIVDPAPDYATLGAAQPVRGRRASSAPWPSFPHADALEPLFQRGDAQEAVVFEPGFAERLARGVPARVLDRRRRHRAEHRQRHAELRAAR